MNNRWLDKPEIGGLRIWILVILLVHAADVSRCVIANDRPAPHPYVQVPFEDYIDRHYRTSEGLASNWIYDVLQTRDGYIWIATHNGVARFDGTKFTIFNRANTPQMPANDTRVLYETSDGSLWIGTVGGLVEYRPGRPGTFHEIEAYRGNSIHAIWEDRTDKLWLGTREETWSRAPGHEFKVEKHAPIHVKAICEDRKGALWLGSDSGVYKSEGTGFQQIANDWLPAPSGASGGIPAAGVNVLLADDNGGVWAGTNQGLLYIKDGQISDRGSEVGRQQIYDMLQTSNGELYVATRYGLQRSVGGQGFEKLLSDELASCLMEDQEGGLWAGYYGNRGLHRYEIGKSTTILSEYRVNCVHENPDGTMWFGSTSGLHRLRDGVITDYGTADGLPDVRVQTIAQGAGETLWIGTRKGFARWSGTGLSTDATPADTARMSISSAFEDSAGVLWYALSSGGGYALQDGTLRGLDALNHGKICWFYEYSDSELWIGHEYGLYCYRDDQIQQVIDPALDRLNSSHFVCHYATKEKTLWLGTSGGIVRWESGQFDVFTSEDGLAADYIEGVKVDGKPLIAVDQFDFRSGPKRLAIEFAAPTFSNPKLAQVKYRLDGYDQDWIDAGEERAAYYTDLGPGEYRFRVIAANGDGVWNEEGVSVPFTVRPRWWETGLFRAAACLAAIGLCVLYSRYRTRRIRSANAALQREIAERERAETASRRHLEELARVSRAASMGELTTSIAHEVKQPLFAIVSNAQTATRMLDQEQPDLPEIREALGDIASDGNRASDIIDHIRSLVRKEDHPKKRVDLNEVASEVIKLVRPELRKRGLTVRSELANALPKVQGDQIELQQVILNLIINGAQAMSHGDRAARELLLTTSTDNGSIELAVRDSGVGLNDTQADRIFEPFFTTKPNGIGMGLAINRTIIKAHGGRIWATSNVDRGATFRFSLPISSEMANDDR